MTATSDAAQEARRAGKPRYSEYDIDQQKKRAKRTGRREDRALLETMRRERSAYIADHPASQTYAVGSAGDALDHLLADWEHQYAWMKINFPKSYAMNREKFLEELAAGRGQRR